MGIKATCRCGAQFMAKPELAGRTLKCPTCGQALQVPNPQAAKPTPTANASTFQVACACGRKYQVPLTMAGKPVQCRACGQQFVIPQASAATRQAPAATRQTPAAPSPDPFADAGPLDDLGDLSSFDVSFGGTMSAGSFSAQAPAASAYGMPGAVARPARKKKSGNKSAIVGVVLSILVVLAILGIVVGTFVFFPFGSRYSTPQAVWAAQKQAYESHNWKKLYYTLTPSTRDQVVAAVAFMAQIGAAQDETLAAIAKKHGVGGQVATPTTTSPAELGQMVSQMQQQMETAAGAIKDKEGFFVEVMGYIVEKSEELKRQMGNQQMSITNIPQELKDVVIDGDSAKGTQSVTIMGRTIDAPVHFRRIDGSWLLHQPTIQEMMNQGGGQ